MDPGGGGGGKKSKKKTLFLNLNHSKNAMHFNVWREIVFNNVTKSM